MSQVKKEIYVYLANELNCLNRFERFREGSQSANWDASYATICYAEITSGSELEVSGKDQP